uniref:Beta-galactosidase n=1 Tax=Nesterenkonia sp. ZD214 TaxID=503994 RepID=B1ABT0_9MICC|nr:beta-galactosidase [Nesterenkonia sp. ZD214]
MHYFRIVPEYWDDRSYKLKALGCMTVETQVPWNMHVPKAIEFHFEGMADRNEQIFLAQKNGLKVILRPPAYICAEWEFHGLPKWLCKYKSLVIRSNDPAFLNKVENFYKVLLPKFTKLLYQNGGPWIMNEVENEYGSFGNDKAYVDFFKKQYEDLGLTTFLFTSDGPEAIEQGSLDDVFDTGNFGSRSDENFNELDAFKKDSPKMPMEFWRGWFNRWSGETHRRDGELVASVIKEDQEKRASVNFYMFPGGTNFDSMNGAMREPIYYPTGKSYDYPRLLTEGGAITSKYYAVKEALKEVCEDPEDFEPSMFEKAYGPQKLNRKVSLFDVLEDINEKRIHILPLSMEDIDQQYGYILYRTPWTRRKELKVPQKDSADRVFIYINGQLVDTQYIDDEERMLSLDFTTEENTLDTLVENMGRKNYGARYTSDKGPVSNLWIGIHKQFNWDMYALELENLDESYGAQEDPRFPSFYRYSFDVQELLDTYVDTSKLTKGEVFLNGFNLGLRYMTAGPTQYLYIPGPLLKKGVAAEIYEAENNLIVLELEYTTRDQEQLPDQEYFRIVPEKLS